MKPVQDSSNVFIIVLLRTIPRSLEGPGSPPPLAWCSRTLILCRTSDAVFLAGGGLLHPTTLPFMLVYGPA
jgi:hypothetical protein